MYLAINYEIWPNVVTQLRQGVGNVVTPLRQGVGHTDKTMTAVVGWHTTLTRQWQLGHARTPLTANSKRTSASLIYDFEMVGWHDKTAVACTHPYDSGERVHSFIGAAAACPLEPEQVALI